MGAAVAVSYGISRWRRMASWGTTEGEALANLPGDELVGQAKYRSTHAVTIDAAAGDVWPWLVQMGQGRGGLYDAAFIGMGVALLRGPIRHL